MTPRRVLVVDDEPGIRRVLRSYLEADGFEVDEAASGGEALGRARAGRPDVVLLDVMLPDIDGLEVLRELRAAADPFVLLVTARAEEVDTLVGLAVGADDYITKPFDANELLARLRAMLRRAGGRSNPVIEHGELRIDPAAHTVLRAGEPVALGGKEFALLLTLLQARPQVLSKARLESALYGFDEGLESNAIEVHIHHLRRKLGESLIKTVRGVGYFVPQDAPAPPAKAVRP